MRGVWLFFAVLLTFAPGVNAEGVSNRDDMPVFYQSRVMPMDTYARLKGLSIEEVLRAPPEDFRPIPLMHHGENRWLTLDEAAAIGPADKEMAAAVEALQKLPEVIEAGGGKAVWGHLKTHRQFIAQRLAGRSEFDQLGAEVRRNQYPRALYLGGLALVGALVGFFPAMRRGPFAAVVVVGFWAAILFDFFGHMMIAQRIPVFSLVEAMYMLAIAVGLWTIVVGGALRAPALAFVGLGLMGLCALGIWQFSQISDPFALASGVYSRSVAYQGCALLGVLAAAAVMLAAVYAFWGSLAQERYIAVERVLWALGFACAVGGSICGAYWAARAFGSLYVRELAYTGSLFIALYAALVFVIDREWRLKRSGWLILSGLASLLVLLAA